MPPTPFLPRAKTLATLIASRVDVSCRWFWHSGAGRKLHLLKTQSLLRSNPHGRNRIHCQADRRIP